jgi:predicted dinucleotide-binding enzyme
MVISPSPPSPPPRIVIEPEHAACQAEVIVVALPLTLLD